MAGWVFFDLSRTLADSPRDSSKDEFFKAVLVKLANFPSASAGLSSADLAQLTLEVKSSESPNRYLMEARIYEGLVRHADQHTPLTAEETKELEAKVKEVLSDQALYDTADYTLWPETKTTLATLRARGYKVGLMVNSSTPVKIHKLIDAFGLAEFLDTVVISAETRCSLPDTYTLDSLVSEGAQLWLVGDMLDRHVLAAQKVGQTGIWLNQDPKDMVTCRQTRNINAIDAGLVQYPKAVVTLAQVPECLAHIAVSPRIRVGYLIPNVPKKRMLGKVEPR
jgi:FMN phosphatase YigB (HAD superfamily)